MPFDAGVDGVTEGVIVGANINPLASSSPQSPQVRRCVPCGLTARLASPLPANLLLRKILAGAL